MSSTAGIAISTSERDTTNHPPIESEQVSHGDGYASTSTSRPSDSPSRPSYSPVTPTVPNELPVNYPLQIQQRRIIDEPDPVPVKLEDNTDAIALQATLSILQIQKQQSQRDIKQLNKMKIAAREDPQAFLDALKSGSLHAPPPRATLDLQEDSDSAEEASSTTSDNRFGRIPNPINVVRAPPINWAKYHVVGEALDKLHEEQRQRPTSGPPRSDRDKQAQQHVVAAPYRPFIDKLEPPNQPAKDEAS